MSSPAQAAASVANAHLSTGPRTGSGKARSSMNAVRHGLTSRTVVLPYENREEYEQLHAEFIAHYGPGSGLEREILARMVDCWWKLQRAQRIEAEFFAQREEAIREGAGGELEEDAALALMFTDPAEAARLRLFMRYFHAAERAWRASLSEYQQVRKSRIQQDRELSAREALQNLPAPAAPLTGSFKRRPAETPAGFVSQMPAKLRPTASAPASDNLALRL